MRVCHVLYLSEARGQHPIGGAERPTLDLLIGLSESGLEAHLLALVWEPGPTIERELSRLRDAGVVVHVVNRPSTGGRLLRAVSTWLRSERLLRAIGPSIVHVHLDLVVVPLVARRSGGIVVVTVHNDEPFYRSWRWRAWFGVLRSIVGGWIAISDQIRSALERNTGFPSGEIEVIHYGVRRPARRPLDLPFEADAQGPVIGFVGRLVEQKNVEMLLRVVKETPPWRLVIVGEGPLRPRLEAQAGSCPRIVLLGTIIDAAEVIHAFDVLCLPSRWEGLGLVLVEAMYQGVPAVAADLGATRAVLGGGLFGFLFDPDTPDSLRRALGEALGPMGQERARRASRTVEKRFGPQRYVEETLAFYDRLIDSGIRLSSGPDAQIPNRHPDSASG